MLKEYRFAFPPLANALERDVKSHIAFLTAKAWETRAAMQREKVRKNLPKRCWAGENSRYRFMRLELRWLRAMVAEQVIA